MIDTRGGAARCPCVFVWLLLLCAAGCRAVVGFDEPVEEGTALTGLPLLSFVPDGDHASECKRCAEAQCSKQYNACAVDARCRQYLQCRGTCSDPVCSARCGSYALYDDVLLSGALPGRHGEEVPLFGDYHRCVSVDRCLDACGWGLNYECMRGYRWPVRADDANIRLDLELRDYGVGAPLVNVSAQTPNVGTTALLPIANEQKTSSWGQLQIDLGGTVFDGVLQIDADAPEKFGTLAYIGRVFRDTRMSFTIAPLRLIEFDDALATSRLWIAAFDCAGAPASGLTFGLEDAHGDPFYIVGNLQASLSGPTDGLGTGGFDRVVVNGTPLVSVYAERDGEVVARKTVMLRPGWETKVSLWPFSRVD